MGSGTASRAVWWTGLPLATLISSLLSRRRGFVSVTAVTVVCVMKKVKGPAQAKLGRATLRGQMNAFGWASPRSSGPFPISGIPNIQASGHWPGVTLIAVLLPLSY